MSLFMFVNIMLVVCYIGFPIMCGLLYPTMPNPKPHEFIAYSTLIFIVSSLIFIGSTIVFTLFSY